MLPRLQGFSFIFPGVLVPQCWELASQGCFSSFCMGSENGRVSVLGTAPVQTVQRKTGQVATSWQKKEKLRNERLLGEGGEGEGYAVLETKWELQLVQKAAGG